MRDRMFLRRIVGCILLCILCAHPLRASAFELENVRNSVFRVAVKDEHGTVVLFGSSFAVGTGGQIEYLITNYHVIADRESGVFIWKDDNREIPCTVVLAMPETDLAILQLSEPFAGTPLPLGTQDRVKVGDDVYILGYPKNDISNAITSYPADVSISKGVISKKTIWNDTQYYQIDAAMNSGNSGGPLWHKEGFVVGIATMKMLDSERINGVVMIEEAIKGLKQAGIAFLSAPISPNPSATPNPSLTPIPSTTPIPTTTPVPVQGSSLAWLWLTLFIVAAILFVGVVGFLILKRKGAALPFQNLLQHTKKGKGYVVGSTGMYAGAVIALEGETVFFGRDPLNCQIVFGAEKRMISRVHCSLRYDDKQEGFILENYSKNGTYLSDGRSIGDGESACLYSGNGFYLVDETCAFVVRDNPKEDDFPAY